MPQTSKQSMHVISFDDRAFQRHILSTICKGASTFKRALSDGRQYLWGREGGEPSIKEENL